MKVSITSYGKSRLRIRWRYQSKNYDLRPGLPDTKQNRGYCEAIANKIQADCLLGQFDGSLKRYKPWTIGHDHQVQKCPVLFEKFTEAMVRDKGLHGGSISRYRGCLSHIRKRLNVEAHQVDETIARNFAAYLTEHVSNRTAKEYLWLVRSCFDWAQSRFEVPENNPWGATLSRVSPHVKPRVQPFTQQEIQAILKAFRNHTTYSHYADFVAFLFGSGCRHGEAIALQWKHVDPSFRTVWIGQAFSHGQVKTTKTGKARTVQLSQSLQKLLRDRHQAIKPDDEDLVFSAKNGGVINLHNFRERPWRSILSDCGLFYRKPYVTRHTAISLALENGADPVRIAEQTGHNLKTLLNHYAHVIRPENVFVEVG